MKPLLSTILCALAINWLGCAPVSVSHYRTAEPLGRDNFLFGGGVHLAREAAHGTDEDNQPGDEITQHYSIPNLISNADFELSYGLTDNLDVGMQLWLTGLELNARYTLLNDPEFKVAIGGSAGAFTGDYHDTFFNDEVHEYKGWYAEVPLTLSYHPSPSLAFYGGPLVSHWDATHDSETRNDDGIVTGTFNRTASYTQLGGFVGIALGSRTKVSLGATFYLEDKTYPVESFASDGIYVFPWVGLLFGR